MKASPKVSIVMPTYNRAGLIMESIHSVVRQTYSNWELIIADDGSTDNTADLVAGINDDRIRFFRERRTGVVGKIKNAAIEKTSGDLIAFIDSDDLWDETKLEKQVAALQQYPDAGFSLTGGYNFQTPGNPLGYFYKQLEGIRYDNILIPFFKSEVAVIMPSLVLKRVCLQTTRMFDESKSFADVEFVLALAKNFNAVILYEPLVFRRIHDANDSDSNWMERHFQGLELMLSYKNHLPGTILADALFRSHVNFGEKCLRYKKKRQALESFLRAWKQKPLSAVPLKKIAKTIIH
ncbi:MAG TPA: glycosyltransferase family 2 protein [Chitinophagaceae bacterium]|nr:glycosyltransferase family 2 protein [Chitinophagaceae bacterium]